MGSQDQKETPPSRRDLLKWGARIGGAALLPGCSVGYSPNFLIPNTKSKPSQSGILKQYDEAYHALTQAACDVLLHVKEIEDSGLWKVLTGKLDIIHGMRVVLCPGAEEEGHCFIASQTQPNTPLIDLKPVVAMFSAYAKLCRLQNRISLEEARANHLRVPPTAPSFSTFLLDCRESLPQELRSRKDNIVMIEPWLDGPFNAIRAFTDVSPHFRGTKEDDKNSLKWALRDCATYKIDGKNYMVTVDDSIFPVPSKLDLMELKRQQKQHTPGYRALEALLQLPALVDQSEMDFQHKIRIAGLPMKVELSVLNANFGKPPLRQTDLSSAR